LSITLPRSRIAGKVGHPIVSMIVFADPVSATVMMALGESEIGQEQQCSGAVMK